MDTALEIKHCRNCKEENIDSLRHFPEQICKDCLRKLSRVNCVYCRKDFHRLSSTDESESNVCWKCEQQKEQHGEPKHCRLCDQNSAFEDSFCRHCHKNMERYGNPIMCDGCKKTCAFSKPDSAKKKLQGQNLCYLCARQYKLDQHRDKKSGLKRSGDKKNEPPFKKRKLISNGNINCKKCVMIQQEFDNFQNDIKLKIDEKNKKVQEIQMNNDVIHRKYQQSQQLHLKKDSKIGALTAELDEIKEKYNKEVVQSKQNNDLLLDRTRDELKRLRHDYQDLVEKHEKTMIEYTKTVKENKNTKQIEKNMLKYKEKWTSLKDKHKIQLDENKKLQDNENNLKEEISRLKKKIHDNETNFNSLNNEYQQFKNNQNKINSKSPSNKEKSNETNKRIVSDTDSENSDKSLKRSKKKTRSKKIGRKKRKQKKDSSDDSDTLDDSKSDESESKEEDIDIKNKKNKSLKSKSKLKTKSKSKSTSTEEKTNDNAPIVNENVNQNLMQQRHPQYMNISKTNNDNPFNPFSQTQQQIQYHNPNPQGHIVVNNGNVNNSNVNFSNHNIQQKVESQIHNNNYNSGFIEIMPTFTTEEEKMKWMQEFYQQCNAPEKDWIQKNLQTVLQDRRSAMLHQCIKMLIEHRQKTKKNIKPKINHNENLINNDNNSNHDPNQSNSKRIDKQNNQSNSSHIQMQSQQAYINPTQNVIMTTNHQPYVFKMQGNGQNQNQTGQPIFINSGVSGVSGYPQNVYVQHPHNNGLIFGVSQHGGQCIVPQNENQQSNMHRQTGN